MNRKLEILIGIIIVVGILAFIGVNVFNITFDENKTMGKITEAFAEMDIDYLKDHIEIEGVTEPLADEELIDIVKLLKDYGIHRDDIQKYYDSVSDNIYLKKQGKENFLLDKYILVLKPYNIAIENHMPGTKIYIDDKEIGTIKEDNPTLKHTGLLPGNHKIKGVYEGEYATLVAEDEITCFDNYDNNVEYFMDLGGSYIEISSNIDDATLYINDKNTNIKLRDNYNLGPITTDGSISIQAKVEIDGKIYESEKYFIDDSLYYYELYIDYVEGPDEQLLQDIRTLINNYQYGLMDAINFNNYNYVAPYIENNSPLMNSQIKLIEHLNSKGTQEELLSYEINNIIEVSDTIYEVHVLEKHRIFYNNDTTDEVTNQWIYTVVVDNYSLHLRNIRK